MSFPISLVVSWEKELKNEQTIPILSFNNSFQFSSYLVVVDSMEFSCWQNPEFSRRCFAWFSQQVCTREIKSCNRAWKCNSMTVPYKKAILSSTSTLSDEVTCKHFISQDISRLLATSQHFCRFLLSCKGKMNVVEGRRGKAVIQGFLLDVVVAWLEWTQ